MFYAILGIVGIIAFIIFLLMNPMHLLFGAVLAIIGFLFGGPPGVAMGFLFGVYIYGKTVNEVIDDIKKEHARVEKRRDQMRR